MVQALGDDDGDNDAADRVDSQEVRENDLIAALLSPDVDLLDSDGAFKPRTDGIKDALSLGLGFTAVTASFPFDPPVP